jgi:hypothetical protein
VPPPTRKSFPLRLDPALHDAVERLATHDLRSVNAEIECLLREALKRRGIKVEHTASPPRGRPKKED